MKAVVSRLSDSLGTRRNWRYSKQGLAKVRDELNVQAVERVRGMVEEERVRFPLTRALPPSQGTADLSAAYRGVSDCFLPDRYSSTKLPRLPARQLLAPSLRLVRLRRLLRPRSST